MESKGLCSDTAQVEGVGLVVWSGEENYSTIKEFLINLMYVPKVHMRRMIPIRLKPNSVQAPLHTSSAILCVFLLDNMTLCVWAFFCYFWPRF